MAYVCGLGVLWDPRSGGKYGGGPSSKLIDFSLGYIDPLGPIGAIVEGGGG